MTQSARVGIEDYRPGAIGRIAQLHAEYYSRTHGFGLSFEAKVARELSEFLMRRDPARDFFKIVVADGQVQGSIALDGSEDEGPVAHLRWFLLGPALRGRGIGRKLLADSLAFGRDRGFEGVTLWTLKGLEAAARLYRQAGFQVVEELEGGQWGRAVIEQRMVLAF